MQDADIENVIRGAYAKTTTQQNYLFRLQHLKKLFEGQSYYSIFANPDVSYKKLRETYPNISTRKNVMTVILAVFKQSSQLKELLSQQQQRWKTFHDHMDSFQEAKYKKHVPEPKQLAKYTPMEDMEIKYKELKKQQDPHATQQDSIQLVLLSTVTSIPPKRSDLGKMEIFYEEDPNKTDCNYLVLRSTGISYMVFTKYKSRAATRVDQELPPQVVTDIRDSLRRYPRRYLLVNRFNAPFQTNDAYAKYVVRVFQRLFGKSTSVTMLRHIYITEKVSWEMDDDELEQKARQMLHTTKLQRKYYWRKSAICALLKKMCPECDPASTKQVAA